MKKKDELDPDIEDLTKRHHDIIDRGNATSRLNTALNQRKIAVASKIERLENAGFGFPNDFERLILKFHETQNRRESIYHEISELHDRIEALNQKAVLISHEANKAGKWSHNQKIKLEMMLVEFDQLLKKISLKEDVRKAAYEEELSLLSKAEKSLDTFGSGG